MLTALSTGFHFRLAVALCTLAAACLTLPPAALAFGHGTDTADCLSHAVAVTQGVHGAHGGEAHDVTLPASPQDRGDHGHGTDGPGTASHQAHCCGVFCVSVLLANYGDVALRDKAAPAHFPAGEPNFLSRAPELPDRPPTSPLTV